MEEKGTVCVCSRFGMGRDWNLQFQQIGVRIFQDCPFRDATWDIFLLADM